MKYEEKKSLSLTTSLKWPHSCVQCECETAYFESMPSAHAQICALQGYYDITGSNKGFLPLPVEEC